MKYQFLFWMGVMALRGNFCCLHASERDFNNEYNYYGKPINESVTFPEGESDRAITQAVQDALQSDQTLSARARQIAIYTSYGRVTLRGHVDSHDEKNRVVAIVTLVNNVKSVDNKLEVAGGFNEKKGYNAGLCGLFWCRCCVLRA